ncbi:MAG: hypothetical protein JO232_22525 [Verrucomicrobia bacterium]|nr:hypothetical protein [Verrucomicrobiota bacterium]
MTGKATYSGDRHPDRLLYGYLLTSTVANGSIRTMDIAEAGNSPGVVAIYTPFSPLKLYRPLGRADGPTAVRHLLRCRTPELRTKAK